MSEYLAPGDSLQEILNPRYTPELGFQSYEMVAGDGVERDAQKAAFLLNEVVNPTLDYPNLNEITLNSGIARLDNILSLANEQADPEVRATVWDSAAYRMAEMYWLLSSESLNRTHRSLDPATLDLLTTRTQELNEQLYGKPEKGITDAVVSEVWAQVDDKNLVGNAAEIKQEL